MAKTEVAVKEEGAVALACDELSFLNPEDFLANGFEGVDAESFAIPFLQVLQKMSPLVDEDDAKYIPGAKAGMLLNTVTNELFDGKKGVSIIPCAYKRVFVQWGGREGEGGFKGSFTVEEFAKLAEDPTKVIAVDGRYYKPDEKGEVNEKKSDYFADTREHYVLVINENGDYGRAILSLSSSQIKSSKKLMTSLQQKKVTVGANKVTPPTFANVVRVTTSARSNDQGTWSGVDFELIDMVKSRHMFDEAKQFFKEVITEGSVAADHSKADNSAQSSEVADAPTEAEKF